MTIDQYKLLHASKPEYGTTGLAYKQEVSLILNEIKPKSVLDFGCGKATLISEFAEQYPGIAFYGYDPAIPGREILPVEKVDFVICTDVLEHIPENDLENVIEKIASLSKNVFFYLHHGLAVEILPDGTNAHCTVKPPIWYYRLLEKYFTVITPLPGRTLNTSVVFTFNLSPYFYTEYEHILDNQKIRALENLRALENQVWELENKLDKIWSHLRPIRGVRRILRGDFGPVKTILRKIISFRIN